MTTYNTGNPLGSTDPRDLYDNAENLDTLVNDRTLESHPDRLGVPRKTWHSMEAEFDADQSYRESAFNTSQTDRQNRFNNFIASSGYQFLGDYAAGIEITEYNQIVRDADGEFWRVSGQVDLPYTTTGVGLPENNALTPLGDAVLRQELANPDKGAAMVARGVVAVDSIADLLALPAGQRKEELSYTVRGSIFRWDAGRFVPQGRVSVRAFGATGSGDDTAACQAALDFMHDYAAAQSSPVRGGRPVVTFDNSPTGIYPTTDTLTISRLIDVDMSDTVIYSGPADRPGIVHGEPGKVVWMPKSTYRVSRPTAIWKDSPKERGTETDIGLVLYNFNTANQCLIAMASRFEIGFQAAGSGQGFSYNHISLGYLVDNKVQQWNFSEANGWCNENSWYGGRFTRQSSIVDSRSCIGIRSLAASTSNSTHNSNTWYSPSFEQLGNGIDGDVPVIDAEHFAQCRILNFRDENNGPVLLREGERAFENELTPGYGGLSNYRSKIDDSANPTPSTLISLSPRLKYYDAHTQLVWDSGDIVQRACHVEGGQINVAGMVGAILSDTGNPMGSSSINSGSIEASGVLYPNRALGVFLEMKRDTDTTFLIRISTSPMGEGRPCIVCFDEDFEQIDSRLHPEVARSRQGMTIRPSNLFGGSFIYPFSSSGAYYVQLAKTVKYVAIYVSTTSYQTSIFQRLQILTQSSMMPVRAFVPYDELVPGMNIGKAPPTLGNSKRGKVILNSEPSVGSPYGWRCVEAGNPGVWEAINIGAP